MAKSRISILGNDLVKAISDVLSSLPNPIEVNNHVSHHECGHALAAWHNTFVKDVSYTALTPQGGVCSIQYEDRLSTPELHWALIVYRLGGIAAEMASFGRFRSGNTEQDLKNSLNECRLLLERFPDTTTPWVPRARRKLDIADMFVHRPTSREREILNQCYDQAYRIMEWRRPALHAAAIDLSRHGRLTTKELERHFGSREIIHLAGKFKPGIITFDS